MGQVDLTRTHFLPWVQVTTPANSVTQAVDSTVYFEVGDTVDVYDVDDNGCVISQLASGLTLVDFGKDWVELSAPVDTTLATNVTRVACRTIDDGQEAIDRLYKRKIRRHTAEVTFTAADWRGKDYLKVIRLGVPGANEIGPHELLAGAYLVTFYQDQISSVSRNVHMVYRVDRTTGDITFWRSGGSKAFSGRVEIVYAVS